ncbi:MAG: undecaprenyl-diphosphate phosphatase [Bacteroidetes bacterium]|nr:MAG: undecaprenyl-diphosphate phosphatase [Bacteroidota bacterium]
MGFWEALILGIIQGLTEFLPVSSSGHLELGKALFGDNSVPEESLLFTVVVHAATALSTIVVFRKDIIEIITGLFQFKWNAQTQFSVKVIISMVPAAIVGLLFDKQIEALFNRQVLLVGGMLILTGLLLFLADKARNTEKQVTFWSAFIIGISQAIAILPGISRSGATISTSVLLGIDREKAARFSFLMVIPLILGKIAKDIMDGDLGTDFVNSMPLVVGFTGAFVAGLFACSWMISLVRNSQLRYFSYYCFVVGFLAMAIALMPS